MNVLHFSFSIKSNLVWDVICKSFAKGGHKVPLDFAGCQGQGSECTFVGMGMLALARI